MQAVFFGYNCKKRLRCLLIMVRLRVLEILEEQQHSKYWLYKRMEMSYQNFNRLVNNETSSIHFENIEKLSSILECPIGDLFEITNEIQDDKTL